MVSKNGKIIQKDYKDFGQIKNIMEGLGKLNK